MFFFNVIHNLLIGTCNLQVVISPTECYNYMREINTDYDAADYTWQ